VGVSSLVAAIDPKDATRVSSYTVNISCQQSFVLLIFTLSLLQAYLKPNETRKNLVVLSGAHVTKVLFNTGTGSEELVAEGVKFLHHGSLYTAKAKKEVILSAGDEFSLTKLFFQILNTVGF
jgi:hypothetical protein